MTSKKTTKAESETVQARVVVTPAEVIPPNDHVGATATESGAPTQVMDRQEYADRLRAGASPVNDILLADQDATVAITKPTTETAPVPAVVEISDAEAAKAEAGALEVKVKSRK